MRDFRIFFFKVGNGHCSYVEFPNGKNGLIDIKVSKESDNDNIITILKEANISKIDYLFITHPHQDHIGGLSEVVKTFQIGIFIYSPVYFRPSPIYDDWTIYEQMKKGYYCTQKYEVTEGWYTNVGDETRVDYLAPLKYLLANQSDNVNNNGLLLRICCRGHKLLIPGDIEEDGWEYINDSDIKNTTLLLASHHGNNSGFNLKKVKAMNLAFVVISAGTKTEYDADAKYRNQVRKDVYTTRQKRVVARIDENNTLHMIN
ncbi:MAG: MBL fold metallo-hydrolase [Planctomycetes bacterium]|nr:MBL fold metallo-hydrolase [Planctomycetota bacterium]